MVQADYLRVSSSPFFSTRESTSTLVRRRESSRPLIGTRQLVNTLVGDRECNKPLVCTSRSLDPLLATSYSYVKVLTCLLDCLPTYFVKTEPFKKFICISTLNKVDL